MYILSSPLKAALSSWWIWWGHMTCGGFAIPFDDLLWHCFCVSSASLRGRLRGKPAMCLFVRNPFIIDPYFKTKGNHQSVYLSCYILVMRLRVTLQRVKWVWKHDRLRNLGIWRHSIRRDVNKKPLGGQFFHGDKAPLGRNPRSL